MAAIRHCGSNRIAEVFWLNSEDETYRYELLLTTTCPKCRKLVLEKIGVLPDLRFGPQYRIAHKDHDRWIRRSNPNGGDIAPDMDSSQWRSLKAGVHRVRGSMACWPFILREIRVK